MWWPAFPVGHNPRGLTLSRDGRRLFVANRLEDTISVIDTRTDRVAATITLAGPKTVSALRRGEQTFYTARYSFQGQIGCSSCHIDSTFDGLTWDLEPDGFGRDIVDNRMIEDVKDTEPYKWNGGNPNFPPSADRARRSTSGARSKYDNLTLADLVDLHPQYATQAQPLAAAGRRGISAGPEHGKAIFERASRAALRGSPFCYFPPTHPRLCPPAHRRRRKSLRGASACHHRCACTRRSTPSSRRSPAATSTPSAPVAFLRAPDRPEESRNHALAGPEPCIGPSARWPLRLIPGRRSMRTVNYEP